LLDENIPVALTALLVGHDVKTVRDMGWTGLSNGRLLAAAEQLGFEVLVTADQNLRYQQNMAERRIALVVLSTSHWQAVRSGSARIIQALEGVGPTDFREVALAPHRRRRRAPVGSPGQR
jgi:hypothetical protein